MRKSGLAGRQLAQLSFFSVGDVFLNRYAYSSRR